MWGGYKGFGYTKAINPWRQSMYIPYIFFGTCAGVAVFAVASLILFAGIAIGIVSSDHKYAVERAELEADELEQESPPCK
jgi:hypothetical protein